MEKLLIQGHNVRVVDNLSTGKYANIAEFSSGIEFIEGGIEDYKIARRAVEGIDYIIHLAAIPSVQFSVEDP